MMVGFQKIYPPVSQYQISATVRMAEETRPKQPAHLAAMPESSVLSDRVSLFVYVLFVNQSW